MSSAGEPWRETQSGVEVRVRLTPKSSKDAIDGLTETADGAAFKARVRAVPEDGKANTATETLVARWLGVPPSKVALISGSKSRIKVLAVTGDRKQLISTLADRRAEFD